ncbi:hypothetical protein Godav_015753 [Gossypium davidsonii]|uniref:Uncharacterized protein n=1 Tax=Gossypium davidsonii TaxID=34287 RepID=A0A7J8RQJ8_GOSDV|nr:hypothetical protein [Gossypium davidsonii]
MVLLKETASLLVFQEYPNLIVVDYTVPATVNGSGCLINTDNAELYGKVGVPFVMGTTVGDRDRLYRTVEESKVVAFLAAMEIMAEQFPGAFSGYNLQVLLSIRFFVLKVLERTICVTESHQAGKLDTSGTAKAIISCFQKLGCHLT